MKKPRYLIQSRVSREVAQYVEKQAAKLEMSVAAWVRMHFIEMMDNAKDEKEITTTH